MTVDVFYADLDDNYATSVTSTTYATAYASAASVASPSATTWSAGQNFVASNYQLYMAFCRFDTSAIADSDVVSAVTLSLFGNASSVNTGSTTIQARPYNYGAAVDVSDWNTPTQYNGLTLLGTFAGSGWSNVAYNDFTENGTNFRAAVNKTGSTYLAISSDTYASATAPTGAEYVTVKSADTAGTTNDPKLTVTHAAPALGAGTYMMMGV